MKIQKSSKGEWISNFGGVLVVIGIMCMVFEASSYFIFGFLIAGILVTSVGVVNSLKSGVAKKKIEKEN